MKTHEQVRTKKTKGRYSPSTVPSPSLVNKRFIIRLHEESFEGFSQVQNHSGQCPVQYLENIGPAIEHFDWLILVIGPLSA